MTDKDYVVTRKKCFNEDWKSGYPPIPEGTKVEFLRIFNNLYGTFISVLYDDKIYYLNPYDVDVCRKDES
jgi:hypothetical protein